MLNEAVLSAYSTAEPNNSQNNLFSVISQLEKANLKTDEKNYNKAKLNNKRMSFNSGRKFQLRDYSLLEEKQSPFESVAKNPMPNAKYHQKKRSVQILDLRQLMTKSGKTIQKKKSFNQMRNSIKATQNTLDTAESQVKSSLRKMSAQEKEEHVLERVDFEAMEVDNE